MFFRKKKVVEKQIAEAVESAAEETKPSDAIDEWGDNGKAIVSGYIIKAFRMWNFNNPQKTISDEDFDHFMVGLQMAFTSMPPQKAIELFEEVNKVSANTET